MKTHEIIFIPFYEDNLSVTLSEDSTDNLDDAIAALANRKPVRPDRRQWIERRELRVDVVWAREEQE